MDAISAYLVEKLAEAEETIKELEQKIEFQKRMIEAQMVMLNTAQQLKTLHYAPPSSEVKNKPITLGTHNE